MPPDSALSSTASSITNDGSRRSMRRALGILLAIFGLVLVTTGCLPTLLDPPTSGKTYGKGPLDSISEAADAVTTSSAYSSCGLSSTDLAAMMMVPTYFEAGGPVPAPMALSRWDNVGINPTNANLFAFGATSGAYVNAFFSPGIGLWQFDSAGGWDMTAADAINTATSAGQAADTIAWRWCNAPVAKQVSPAVRRSYAWGPWFGCSYSNNAACESLFNSLSTGGFLNTGFDSSVSRTGGMARRTCNIVGIGNGIECWYINPANGEGSRGWTGGTYDGRTDYVTPLPKPFYSVRANGREYRVWLREDTGYDINITASKPVTSNARTSLTWASTTGLCDVTTGHGLCNPPRVATTPWGAFTGNPLGNFESVVSSGIGRIVASGWSVDPDTNDPVIIHVYIDGAWGGSGVANGSRPDVGASFAGYGNLHGYNIAIDASPGSHSVCTFAINVAPYGDTNPAFGCRVVTVPGDPVGSLDTVVPVVGGVKVSGWTIDPDVASPVIVKVTVDGQPASQTVADAIRPDIAAAFPRYGGAHGYTAFAATTGGAHRICTFATNIPPSGSVNTGLGCSTVTVSGQVFGNVESISGGPGGVVVTGWAIDPETGDSSVRVTVDGVATTLPTTTPRPDVASAFPVFSGPAGFRSTIPASGGTHTVCVTLLNQGGVGNDQAMGCRTAVVVSGNPFGNLESVVRTGGGLTLTGWALDPDAAGPVTIHVYVDGLWGGLFPANIVRPDVGAYFANYGSEHGFTIPVSAGRGPVSVCAYLINQGAGTTNPLLGCRTL